MTKDYGKREILVINVLFSRALYTMWLLYEVAVVSFRMESAEQYQCPLERRFFFLFFSFLFCSLFFSSAKLRYSNLCF